MLLYDYYVYEFTKVLNFHDNFPPESKQKIKTSFRA